MINLYVLEQCYPYFIVYPFRFTVVHKTEVIKVTLNPTWKPFTIPVRALCNGDYDRVIKMECYDWDKDGGHDFIGESFTTLNELKRGPCEANIYECISPKKRAKKGKKYKNSGTVSGVYWLSRSFTFFVLFINICRLCNSHKSYMWCS